MTRNEILQTAKPILFNTEMVRAILDGRKTVTRQPVKGIPKCAGNAFKKAIETKGYFKHTHNNGKSVNIYPPYNVGDILYVRETWKQATCDPDGGGYALTDMYLYKADEPIDTTGMNVEDKWHPSIHMPKEAARIFLRVTDVRVERLQDITEEQAICEGCNGVFCGSGANMGDGWEVTPIDEYIPLWNSTVKKIYLAKYGWDANPWVWVIEFEKVEVE